MLDIITDETVVDGGELARVMRVCRATICNWKNMGYEFEFGKRTTPGHCKAWLREQARGYKHGAATGRLVLEKITDPEVLGRINAMAARKGVRA